MFIVTGCYCPNENPMPCNECTMEKDPTECDNWRIENKASVVLAWVEA